MTSSCHQCIENSLKAVKFKYKDPDAPSSPTALNLSLSPSAQKGHHLLSQHPTYPSGRSPPRFWHFGPAEPSYHPRGRRASPRAGRCRTCTRNPRGSGPRWSSPAGSTASEEPRITETHINQVAPGLHAYTKLSLNTSHIKHKSMSKRLVGEETLTCLYFLIVRCHSSISDQARSHGLF